MNDLLSFSVFVFVLFFDPGAQHQAVMVLGISLATMLPTEGTIHQCRDANCRCGKADCSYGYVLIII